MQSSEQGRFSLSTGTMIRFFGLLILVLALYKIYDVLIVVLAAVVIASAVEPVIRRLKHHFGLNRILSVIILYVLLIAALAALLVFFIPLVLNDLSGFVTSLPNNISLQELWNPILGPISEQFSNQVIPLSDFISGFQSLLVGTSGSVIKTASTIFGGVISLLLILVLSFYLAAQEEGVDVFLRIIAPVRKHDYILNLWKRAQRKIGFWLQGQILLSIIVGLLVYAVLLVVGIPYALVLAVLAACFEIIPVFGPMISSVPAILIAFGDKGVGTGLLLIGLYLLIYQFESNIFYPLVVQKVVGINPIVVILALVIGLKLAGILGAIIAVPVSAALMEYINDIERRKKNQHNDLKAT